MMVNIILCGTAGTGKHRLIADLRKSCSHLKRHVVIQNIANDVLKQFNVHSGRDFHSNDTKYEAVQKEIVKRQCEAELKCKTGYITDNSIVGCLVHAQMCLEDERAAHRICSSDIAREVLERYRSSLVVLMCYPPTEDHHSIGLQCKTQEKNASRIKTMYKEVLNTHSIPFIELVGADLGVQRECLDEALHGKIPLYSASLENYEAQKKVDQGKKNHSTVEVQKSFSFFKSADGKPSVIQIPTIKIKEHSYEQIWTCYSTGKTNRFISVHGHSNLACVEFEGSIRSSRVQKCLLHGLTINGELYNFLGCSSGGLKKRKCFMWKGSETDAQTMIESLGNFRAIKTVSKRLARIALLFSEVQLTKVQVSDGNVYEIDDIITNGNNFTDGCGFVGRKLAEQIFAETNSSCYDKYLPSVYQIRLNGYKGVLALDADPRNSDKLGIRPSMEKFVTHKLPNIGICDHSIPNTFGNLNKQFIMLLSALGVTNDVFLNKQQQYLEIVDSMTQNPESATLILQWQDKFDIAQLIARAGHMEAVPLPQKKMVKSELKTLQNSLKGKAEKLSILIPESRNLFGICDPSLQLNYGECFLRLTLSGKPTTIRGKVVVCKNPCYLLGDVRVLKAVSEADRPDLRHLHHLVDCLVFPCKGKRPHPAEIAGSDLDGDKFFVSWDTDIIPRSVRPPYDYPAMKTNQDGLITTEKIIEYFSRQNETGKLLGKLNSLFIRWADKKSARCDECERLGQLFSRAVDAVKTGEALKVPPGLEYPLDDSETHESTQIWQIMTETARQYKETAVKNIFVHEDNEISEEFVLEIIGEEFTNITEYDKFRFAWNFTKKNLQTDDQTCVEYFVNKFSQYFNFGKLSIEEKREALLIGFPRKLLLNALTTSRILSEEDLQHFQMDSSACTWSRLLFTDHEDFEWKHLLKVLTTYDKSLIVLAMPDDVIIQVQFDEKQTIGKEILLKPGNVTAIFISKHFRFQNKYVLGPSFYIDLTEDTIQLYRDKDRTQTLIWLKKSDLKLTKGRWNKSLSDEIVNSISMDIQRFPSVNSKGKHPLINKIPFVGIEMYAQESGGEGSYWDIHDANDISEINEEMERETEDEQEFDTIIEGNHFQEVPFRDMLGENLDKETTNSVYENIVEVANPIQFLSLCKTYPLEPAAMLEHFTALLENVISMTTPSALSTELCSVIENTNLLIQAAFETETHGDVSHLNILRLTCSLSKLNMPAVAHKVINRLGAVTCTSTNSFIEVLGNLPSFWILDTNTKLVVLELFYRSIRKDNNHVERDEFKSVETHTTLEAESSSTRKLERYIQHFGFLHGLHLLYDMASHRHLLADTPTRESTESLKDLKLDRTHKGDSTHFTFYKTSALSFTDSFMVGQMVAISIQKLAINGPTARSVCAFGTIQDLLMAPMSITIKVEHKVPEIITTSMKTEGIRYWRLDIIGNMISFKRITAALKLLWNKQSDSIITEFLGLTGSCVNEDDFDLSNLKQTLELESPPSKCDSLNDEQSSAVITALKDRVCLIQGPPGTGKTSVACSIVKQIVTNNIYNSVLVVAETNAAVDNLARRLRKHLLLVRLGTTNAEDLYDISLEGHLKRIAANEARKTNYRDEYGDAHRNPKLVNRIIKSADVVLATCVGAGEMALADHMFEFVLVDEATKTMETTLMCALAHGARHLVMVGDHKQLGPLVPTDQAIHAPEDLPNIQELSESLFHRIHETKSVCFLETQYRMHPKIMEFPSREFYDNRLKADNSTKTRDPIEFDWPIGKHVPICFINVEGKERKDRSSYVNDGEIDVVEEVIHRLLNSDFVRGQKDDRPLSVTEIGVLTLYQGQEKALRGRIQNNITVKSVDGFQGQERDVIVVSTVRCNDRGAVGFSGDANRINVLLTRAKRGLIVIGNSETLKSAPIWNKWLQSVPSLVWPIPKTEKNKAK